MTVVEREQLLTLNENLCRQYNESEDSLVLEQIAVTEHLLFYDPDKTPTCAGCEVCLFEGDGSCE